MSPGPLPSRGGRPAEDSKGERPGQSVRWKNNQEQAHPSNPVKSAECPGVKCCQRADYDGDSELTTILDNVEVTGNLENGGFWRNGGKKAYHSSRRDSQEEERKENQGHRDRVPPKMSMP